VADENTAATGIRPEVVESNPSLVVETKNR
jgi:hypothetical protein